MTTIFAHSINPILSYERGNVYQGEIWRLISGHFVHFNTYHALMNMAGFILIKLLFPTKSDNKLLPLAIFFIALSSSLALLIEAPGLDTYQGFSGILHGLLAFFLVVHIKRRPTFDWLILFALIVKLTLEQLPGYDMEHLKDVIDVPIAVNAHLFGAFAGFLLGGGIKFGKVVQT